MVWAIGLFAVTMTLVIWQPRGLSVGWPAAAGAALALVSGLVAVADALEVTRIVWNATLTLIAIIVYSYVLDAVGFFEWAALHMMRIARGSGTRLFVYVTLLGAVVSCLFSNDGAVLILTPILLAKVRELKLPEKMVLPFVMAGGFIADAGSMPLVVSNLVNIISADYFGIGFGDYALRMLLPYAASVAASVLMLLLLYRRDIPRSYDTARLKSPAAAIRHRGLFAMSWAILGVLVLGFLFADKLSVPICAVAGLAAAAFLAAAGRTGVVSARGVLREAPWTVVIFSIGMYVVVYGLRNAGLTDVLGSAIERLSEEGLWWATIGMGFLSTGLSSVMNNLPSVMIGALAIDGTNALGTVKEALVYANVIGNDLGPKMTPIGSLATLLWLHQLSRKGVRIGWGYYFKIGIALTIPTLFVTLAALYAVLRWS
ncbi:MAG: arsenic transporter [Paenibacillaceae bacterium]|nr:arsenic transporter [Paenibacillaceae bacterium]